MSVVGIRLGDVSTALYRRYRPETFDEVIGQEHVTDPLKAASKDLQAAAMYFMENGVKNPNNALAGSYDFMHLMGHVCFGLMWGRMARAALDGLAADTGDKAFLETKIATGRYYMARQLPATRMHLARIESGADSVMALAAEAF